MVHVLVYSGCHNETPKARWLKSQKLFSHSSGDWQSNIEVPVGSMSGKDLLLGLQMATVLLCPHMAESEESKFLGVSLRRTVILFVEDPTL